MNAASLLDNRYLFVYCSHLLFDIVSFSSRRDIPH
jgi:hypothetical protein